MISLNNGSQGIYVAGEGLEQKLFQVGNNLLIFDGKICPRLVRGVEAHKDNFDGLVNKIAQEYDLGKVIVCSSESQKVFAVGKRQICDVSQGYKSSEVCVNFSGSSLNDFVDFVEHSQSTQFGFVLNYGASALFSQGVKISEPTALYSKDELFDFADVALSWFNKFIANTPQELKVFVQNFCALNLADVYKSIKSAQDPLIAAYKNAVSALLVGTSYYTLHQEYFALQRKLSESTQKKEYWLNMRLVQSEELALSLFEVLERLESKGYVSEIMGEDFMPLARNNNNTLKGLVDNKYLNEMLRLRSERREKILV